MFAINYIFEKIMSYHVPVPLLKKGHYRPLIILRNLLRRNRIVRHFYRWDELKKNKGFCVFVVRQISELDLVELVKHTLTKYGFEITNIKDMKPQQISYFTSTSEFWDTKVFHLPYTCIFVNDKSPIPMYPKYYRHPAGFMNSPHMDTGRILVKALIRSNIRNLVKKSNIFLHCTDNFEETMEYYEIVTNDK